MEYKSDVVFDLEGNVVSGAIVLVLAADGQTEAVIYDAAGAQIDNPLTTDNLGGFGFAAPNGKYFIQVSIQGQVFGTRGPISFFDGSNAVSAADYATLQDALDVGGGVMLNGGEYEITSTTQIPSNSTLVGPGTLKFSSADFTATTKTLGPTSVVLSLENVQNVTLRDVTIEGTCGVNAWSYALTVRGAQNIHLENVEISGLNAGACILVDSSTDVWITNPHLHDCTLDRNISGGQLTGILTDDFRIGGVATERLFIISPDIKKLWWTPAFLAAYGPQTDGININAGTRFYQIDNAVIDEVGEGIDTFGEDGTINSPIVSRALGFGIKFIHGASRNTLNTPRVDRSGLGGIVVSGSDSVTQNTDSNTINFPVITRAGYDPTGHWAQPTYGIGINNDGATYKATNTRVREARVLSSPDADGAFQSATSGVGNVYDRCESDGTAAVEYLGSGAQIHKRSVVSTATLASGTATVANTSVTANTLVFPSSQSATVTGALRAVVTAGTGFTITSSNASDAGLVAYQISEAG